MSDLVYRIRDESLYHAFGTVGHYDQSKYKKVNAKERYSRNGKNAAPIIGRTARTTNPFGNYASPYYDPVARQERYLREKAAKGGNPFIEKGKSKGSGGSGKGGKGGSGKGGKGGSGKGGSGKGSSQNLQNFINALKEESQKNTEAKSEEAQKRISDLRKQLAEHIEKLSSATGEEEGVNIAELRGKIQTLKSDMAKTGEDFNTWVSEERKALKNRIAALRNSK